MTQGSYENFSYYAVVCYLPVSITSPASNIGGKQPSCDQQTRTYRGKLWRIAS